MSHQSRDVLWKLVHRVLPVGQRVAKFSGPDFDSQCALCASESETLTHLFLDCPVAAHLWQWMAREFASLTDVRLQVDAALVSLGDTRSNLRAAHLSLLCVLRAELVRAIWYARCQIRYNDSFGYRQATAVRQLVKARVAHHMEAIKVSSIGPSKDTPEWIRLVGLVIERWR